MLNTLTLTESAEGIREGKFTSEALVRACLDRIDAREAEVGAWIALDRQAALQAARDADAGPLNGPLHGVPIGVKDIIDTVDLPTGLGFAPYQDRRSVWDASCVAACRKAGAIVLGKTVTTEFAYFGAGKTRNPHDLTRTPGGSSSGSAAAVADLMVPAAFGSQTAGSLTRPAGFCGIVGYKASRGQFSLSGMRPLAESLDSLGLMARAVADVALLRDVLIDRTPRNLDADEQRQPRIGFWRSFHWADVEPAARALTEAAATALSDAGAQVVAVDLPAQFEQVIEAQKAIMAYEAARNYVFERAAYRGIVTDAFMQLCEFGAGISRESYEQAQGVCAAGRAEFALLFSGYDAWLAPSALGEAPLIETGTGDPVMSRLWTMLHACSVSLPVGFGPNGLPIGAQLVAPAGSDDQLIRTAAWAERRLSWQATAALDEYAAA